MLIVLVRLALMIVMATVMVVLLRFYRAGNRLWRWVAIAALFISLWSTLSSATRAAGPLAQAAAPSVEVLQQQRQQTQQQLDQVSKERTRLQRLENAAQGTLKGLQKTITLTASQIKAREAELQKATKTLRQLETSLTQAEQSYYQKQMAMVARLRFMQQQVKSRGWAVLLQSKSLTDFLDRRYQLKRVYQADQKILVSLRADAERLDAQRDRVEQTKNDIELLRQQLALHKSELEAQSFSQQDMINRLRTDKRALEVAEAQLEQDSRNIAVLIQQRHGRRIAFRGTGRMMYPCDGEITSSFGWRMHPILGYQKFHAGLDFGADYGTIIRAADSGTVIFAGWYGGYGNAVIIEHGDGLTTLYGHTSELYVQEGETVQRSQPIAAVGSTGLSTGPHLHFEVRRDGEPTDPIAYL